MSAPNFAEVYERLLVPPIFRLWGNDLVDRVRPRPAERMLDVACGTGIVARLVLERCGALTRITGVDLNPEMIAVARSRAPEIDWREGNAGLLPVPSGAYDVVLCQQGLQFFPDRALAIREMRRALAEGGRIALSTWRPIEENPLFHAVHVQAAARFGPREDRRFSFGDANAISALLAAAGFRAIEAITVTLKERIADVRMFLTMNLSATISSLDEMNEDERLRTIDQFQTQVAGILARFSDGVSVIHPVSANVVMARV